MRCTLFSRSLNSSTLSCSVVTALRMPVAKEGRELRAVRTCQATPHCSFAPSLYAHPSAPA
jgi:hypothetical protein